MGVQICFRCVSVQERILGTEAPKSWVVTLQVAPEVDEQQPVSLGTPYHGSDIFSLTAEEWFARQFEVGREYRAELNLLGEEAG